MVRRLFMAAVLCGISSTSMAQSTEKTRIEWVRLVESGPIKVTGTKVGGRHRQANDELQRVADILDGLRTVERFVVWQRIAWNDGRLSIEAFARSATMANVATMALRRFFPGYGSAGTGIKQIRGFPGFTWKITAQLYPQDAAKRP